MTTDITELAQREKFEAWWEREYKHLESSKYTDAVPHIKYGFWMAYQAGGAELVEALEKAQQYAKERDAENQELMLTVGRLRVERENLECSHNKLRESMAAIHNTVRLDGVNTRLSTILSASKHAYDESSTVSALESRTVTVKLPKLKMLEDYLAEVAVEERKAILLGVRMEFHRALNAAGIKWEVE